VRRPATLTFQVTRHDEGRPEKQVGRALPGGKKKEGLPIPFLYDPYVGRGGMRDAGSSYSSKDTEKEEREGSHLYHSEARGRFERGERRLRLLVSPRTLGKV